MSVAYGMSIVVLTQLKTVEKQNSTTHTNTFIPSTHVTSEIEMVPLPTIEIDAMSDSSSFFDGNISRF